MQQQQQNREERCCCIPPLFLLLLLAEVNSSARRCKYLSAKFLGGRPRTLAQGKTGAVIQSTTRTMAGEGVRGPRSCEKHPVRRSHRPSSRPFPNERHQRKRVVEVATCCLAREPGVTDRGPATKLLRAAAALVATLNIYVNEPLLASSLSWTLSNDALRVNFIGLRRHKATQGHSGDAGANII